MELKIWKNQKEVERTLTVDKYDIMFGTIEDLLSLIDKLDELEDDDQLFLLIKDNLPFIKHLIKDMFYEFDVTDEDLRKVKIKELVPLMIELVKYCKNNIGFDDDNSTNTKN